MNRSLDAKSQIFVLILTSNSMSRPRIPLNESEVRVGRTSVWLGRRRSMTSRTTKLAMPSRRRLSRSTLTIDLSLRSWLRRFPSILGTYPTIKTTQPFLIEPFLDHRPPLLSPTSPPVYILEYLLASTADDRTTRPQSLPAVPPTLITTRYPSPLVVPLNTTDSSLTFRH